MFIIVFICLSGGPSVPVTHPKRSPTSTGEGDLKEERLPSRKASCSVVGSRSIPPSSPMVSTANNPNKSEIPDRRKDINATTVIKHRKSCTYGYRKYSLKYNFFSLIVLGLLH